MDSREINNEARCLSAFVLRNKVLSACLSCSSVSCRVEMTHRARMCQNP